MMLRLDTFYDYTLDTLKTLSFLYLVIGNVRFHVHTEQRITVTKDRKRDRHTTVQSIPATLVVGVYAMRLSWDDMACDGGKWIPPLRDACWVRRSSKGRGLCLYVSISCDCC